MSDDGINNQESAQQETSIDIIGLAESFSGGLEALEKTTGHLESLKDIQKKMGNIYALVLAAMVLIKTM